MHILWFPRLTNFLNLPVGFQLGWIREFLLYFPNYTILSACTHAAPSEWHALLPLQTWQTPTPSEVRMRPLPKGREDFSNSPGPLMLVLFLRCYCPQLGALSCTCLCSLVPLSLDWESARDGTSVCKSQSPPPLVQKRQVSLMREWQRD